MGGVLMRRLLLSLILVCGFSAPVAAETPLETLLRLLQLDEVVTVMRDEGLQYGQDLDDDMLGGTGGAHFAQTITRIYDAAWMRDTVISGLVTGLNSTDVAASLRFYETDLGQKIISLENAARTAMSDPEVEDIARNAYVQRKGEDDTLLNDVTKIVEYNDLLERNVAGALSSSYQFYLGLSESDFVEMDEDSILTEVWSQEADVRDDTETWVYGFLLMAYKPLTHAEMESYAQFSKTKAGRALNAALFDGFDEMYRQISYRLGQSVGQAMGSSDI